MPRACFWPSANGSSAFLAPCALAQPLQGLYIGGGAGGNFVPPVLSPRDTTKLYTDPGASADIAIGWGYGNGLRAEIEASFRSNGVSSIGTRRTNGALEPLANIAGSARTYGLMANAAYDIPYYPLGLQPYVGVGAGYAWLDMSSVSGNERVIYNLPQANTVTAPSQVTFGTSGAFAYQAYAGAAYALPFLRGVSATLEYRFFGTLKESVPVNYVSTATGDTVNGVLPSASVHKSFELAEHSVLIGLRYAFGAPARPPAAPYAPVLNVPPQAATRSFLVFFDWDKADLTARASQIVAEAAATSTKVQVTRIEVDGYTDTSGTPKYNQGLSIRRAQAVAAELIKDGVPKSQISIQGYGETHLLVATGPGVREPQNRRVEIILK